jgi:hypothetical protein
VQAAARGGELHGQKTIFQGFFVARAGTRCALSFSSNDKDIHIMELHHPDFAELTQSRLPQEEAPSASRAESMASILPLQDENLQLALQAWN